MIANVILNLASSSRQIGTLNLSPRRVAQLTSFEDHVDKPMNNMLTRNEIAELKEQNAAAFAAVRAGEPDAEFPFTEDENITLEFI